MKSPLKVAFVTGGHAYDLPAMQEMLRTLPGMEVYPQHIDDWCCAGATRQSYDAVVFYHMLMDGPTDEGACYQGKVKSALEELGGTTPGIVVLHHALLAYPQWKFWNELVGIPDRKFDYRSGQQFSVRATNASHPIVRGLGEWEMTDETYIMENARTEDGNDLLLDVDHEFSMKTLAWTRQFKNARVFCFQSGHDALAYGNPMFREVLARGIRWVAPAAAPADLPVRMQGVVFSERGRAELEERATPVCSPGHILCKTIYSGLTNGTERNVLMGGNYGGTWPARSGYQNVGRVLEVGAGVVDYAVGDTVFSGAFHQHVRYFVQDAIGKQRLVVKLPPEIDPRHAALFGMASVAMHDVRRAATKLGERVLVVGAGPVGLFTVAAAHCAGARVSICDINEGRLALARRLGAERTIAIAGNESWAEVKAAGPFDIVFEDSGADLLDRLIGYHGSSVLTQRGKLVMVAGRRRVDYSFNAGQSLELDVSHVSHFERDDLEQLCRFMALGAINIGAVVQDIIPISAAPVLYERLRDRPESLLGTVFDWTNGDEPA